MCFKEMVSIIFISTLETLIIMCGLILIINLIQFNYDLAIRFCEWSNIPKDLALTITSIGFAYNLTLILTIVGIVIFIPFFKLLMFLGDKVHDLMHIY